MWNKVRPNNFTSRSKGHWAGIRLHRRCASSGLLTSTWSSHCLTGWSGSKDFLGLKGSAGVVFFDSAFPWGLEIQLVIARLFIVYSDTFILPFLCSEKSNSIACSLPTTAQPLIPEIVTVQFSVNCHCKVALLTFLAERTLCWSLQVSWFGVFWPYENLVWVNRLLLEAADLKTGLVRCTRSKTAVGAKAKKLNGCNELKRRFYQNFLIQTACSYAAWNPWTKRGYSYWSLVKVLVKVQ